MLRGEAAKRLRVEGVVRYAGDAGRQRQTQRETRNPVALRDQVESGVRRLKEIDAERRALSAAASERAQRQDYLAFSVREIDARSTSPI